MTRQEQRDRDEYAGYVARRLADYREHAGWSAGVWQPTYTIAQGQMVAAPPRDESDAFVGPWHTVRPYVTEEFRVWVDEYFAERLTFTEWQATRRHDRERERIAREEFEETGDAALDSLTFWRELDEQRDRLIVQARTAGKSFAQLRVATGMSRAALAAVVAKHTRADIPDVVPAEWVAVVSPEGVTEYAF
ncbi:hypothetical protein ACFWGP_05440 [Agromyces sp. NPDC127015]|uniref:hypothetical protein n=1 Tax=Agromyces sp. NPDC127015 TaxID=3347108 RepID=UPI003651E8C5